MFKSISNLTIGSFLVPLFFMGFVLQTHVTAQESDPYAKFGNHTEDSDVTVNHAIWNQMLDASVIVVKSASARKPSKSRPATTGSKISRGSRAPAPIEGNRVVFHLLNRDHIALVSQYRRDLENLPNKVPLANLSKDEQLAYWLNLYNAVVFEQLAKRYPISKLKNLRQSKRDKPSLWDQKLVTVNGVALSLNDIQNNILIRHWQDPMIIYGLYQGAIGGPSLPNKAFTGENVHDTLMATAQKFVSSDRAVRVRSSGINVSIIYDWGKAAFPNWEAGLSNHLASIVKDSVKSQVANARSFDAKLYDWDIADTEKAKLSTGSRTMPSASSMIADAKSQCDNDLCPAGSPSSGGN